MSTMSDKKLSAKLTEIKKARLYEHHSPTPGMGQQCFYDLINHKTLSVNYFPNQEEIDIMVHNGPTMPKNKLGFTSYRSNVWGDLGNGTTKFMLAPDHLDYDTITPQCLIDGFDDLKAGLTIENVTEGQLYLTKIRGGKQFALLKINKVVLPEYRNYSRRMFIDCYVDFEYKYYTINNTNLGLRRWLNGLLSKELIIINTPPDHVIYIKNKVQLETKIIPREIISRKVKWSVSDKNIAKINHFGLFQAISKGEVIVTAELENSNISTRIKLLVKEHSSKETYLFQ